ncbi:NPCBM/NEW2 domain-containing protein [Deinococcus sp.]|uniref:NPCBM/NEW2 domain-containing protein n=1 Tax=Deinococcus sp. TaxID=47478 RepID=UPI003C7C50E3
MLLFAACNQSATPAGVATAEGQVGVKDPYAGGVSYPWSDRLETVPAGSDPYAGGRSYPWVGVQGSGSLGKLAATTNYLSNLTWTSATSAWGPAEKDTSNGEQYAGDGHPITIGGQVYAKGLGVHANSELQYTLGGNCTIFTASVGIDDEVGNNGSVNFQLWSGNSMLYDSGRLTGSDSAKAVSVNISGVQTLRLVVTDAGDGGSYDHADWGDAAVSCESSAPPTGTTQISALGWQSASNGWGPVEKNQSNGEQGAADGKPLTIGGVVYASGLGVHSASQVSYSLGGNCTVFTASVGIDDEVGNNGSVNFQLWSGNSMLYDSGKLTGSDSAKAVSVNISGVQTLRLVVTDAGDGGSYDHADWGDAKVTCNLSDTTPPAAPTGLIGNGTTSGVSLDWADNTESDLAGYAVSRSSSAAGPFTVLNTALLTVSAYLDSTAPTGTTLYYQVVAVDKSGNASAPASVKVTSVGGPAPSLSVKNLSVLPSDTRLVFHNIGVRNSYYGDVVHDTNGLRLSNAGPGALRVTALDIVNTDGRSTVDWKLDPAPTLPFDIAPGASVDITLRFVAATDGKTLPVRFDAQLNIVSNDTAHNPLPITLAGLFQTYSENGVEPSVGQIASLFGYSSLIPASTTEIGALDGLVTPQTGDEVLSGYWRQLDASQPVKVTQIAAFHNQGTYGFLYTYDKGNSGTTQTLFTHNSLDSQSLLPRNNDGSALTTATFTPTGSNATFGFKTDGGAFSDPVLNPQLSSCTNSQPNVFCGNFVRFFQLYGANRAPMPGQYLMIMDYTGGNYDYNDNMYVVSNVRPAPLLLNVGGPAFTDPANQVWQPDLDQNNNALFSPPGAVSEPASPYTGPVGGTSNPTLYRTYRGKLSSGKTLTFNIPLNDGTYTVKLHMIDQYWQTAGQRVFNVYLQNSSTPSLSNEDIIARVGPKAALVETLPNVQVSGGKLVVTLTATTDFVSLSGIEVVR